MTSVLDVLEELEANGSRLVKMEILEREFENTLLKQILLAALNPYTNYGIAKFKMPKADASYSTMDYGNEDPLHDQSIMLTFLQDLLPDLASRRLRGNAAKAAVESVFGMMNKRQQKWCKRILLQNLRVGLQASTVNKVWTDLIPRFEVQLAKQLKTHVETNEAGEETIVIDDMVNYPVLAEPKLDGLRCISVKKTGTVTMFTRNGRVITTLPQIAATLEGLKYDNMVFDAEAMGEDWNESASIVGSKKTKRDDSNIRLNVFDGMTLEQWLDMDCPTAFAERSRLVGEAIKDAPDRVRLVTGRLIHNETELLVFYEQCIEKGYEGIMLKDPTAPYAFKRTDAMLKMKPKATYEGVIVGHYDGRDGTKNAGGFGGFYVVFPNGVVTRCGGGFGDVARAEIQLNRDSYVGRIIEVEGQPPMTKEGRVRFPVFVRYRDESDVDPLVVKAYEEYEGDHTQN